MLHVSWEHLKERISKAEDVNSLRAIREHVHELHRDPLLFVELAEDHAPLNAVHDAFIRRAVELAAMRTAELGFTAPGLTYAFVLFGSGGRSEQTLWSDQDNGLVYQNPRSADEAAHAAVYFERLANEVHSFLLELGYPPCTGQVLVSNAMWRKPYSEYERMVESWMEQPQWENIRYLLIFADIRCLYGDVELIARLKRVHLDYVKRHPVVLKSILRNTLHHQVSMGVFGQLITVRYGEDAGGIDIKYGAYIPIVNGIRLLAVQAGIAASSSLERINQLEQTEAVSAQLADDLRQVTTIMLKLRAMTRYQKDGDLYVTRGRLHREALTKQVKHELKMCLRIGRKLQRYVTQAVKGEKV